jgi:DNA polymerase-3 subunit epsilon
MRKIEGVLGDCVFETPVAIVDLETTGLTPGYDKIVEISVVRVEPGGSPELVLDSLINPQRPMAATEIHGITDADVANAPSFRELAGDVVLAMSGCVVAAYNVYFDIGFITRELADSGVRHVPPHMCLMYMRPMLGLGRRCRLEEACRLHGIENTGCHVAASDALASAELLRLYMESMRERGVHTFGDLGRLKKYKFADSFAFPPLPVPSEFSLGYGCRQRARSAGSSNLGAQAPSSPLAVYWDTLRAVLADLEITDDEVSYVMMERARLGLSIDDVRYLHARLFSAVLSQFLEDKFINEKEVAKLRAIHNGLSRLGWAPGN